MIKKYQIRRSIMSKIIQLFISFFKIGLVSFGGGYVIIPMIDKEIIYKHNWIDSSTFANIVGIAAVTPGPISLNTATFVGNKKFGIIGGMVSTAGVVLPSFIITLFISGFYFKNSDQLIQKTIFYVLKPLIVGMIFIAALNLSVPAFIHLNKSVDYVSVILFIFSFLLLLKTKINPILIIPLVALKFLISALMVLANSSDIDHPVSI